MIWVCQVCGFEVEADEAPDCCEVCGAGSDQFEAKQE